MSGLVCIVCTTLLSDTLTAQSSVGSHWPEKPDQTTRPDPSDDNLCMNNVLFQGKHNIHTFNLERTEKPFKIQFLEK